MAKTHKRVLSLVLSLVMVLSLLPIQALAIGEPTYDDKETATAATGVTANKEVSGPDSDGWYTITLSVQGNTTTTPGVKNLPADVVLVVDTSTSMEEKVDSYATCGGAITWSNGIFGFGSGWYCSSCGKEYNESAAESNGYVCNNQVRQNRLDVAKAAATQFATGLMNASDQVRIGVYDFSGSNRTNFGLSSDLNLVLNAINGLSMPQRGDGTDYGLGLSGAQGILGASEPGRAKFVVFLSDGEPQSGNNGTNQAAALRQSGVTIMTVGIDMDNSAMRYLQNISSTDSSGNYYCYSASSDGSSGAALSTVLALIQQTIEDTVHSGTNAVMTDVVNTSQFEYQVPSGSALVDGENGTLTWNIGTIGSGTQSVSFQVKPREDVYGDQLHTNTDVTLSFNSSQQNQGVIFTTGAIGDPTVNVAAPTYPYTVNYYKDSVAEGNLVDRTSGSAEEGTQIPYNMTVPSSLVGYKFGSVDPENPTVSSTDDNVVNVVFVRDDENTHELTYYVQYYRDGVADGSPVSQKATVWAGSNEIPVSTDNIDTNKYLGYRLASTDPVLPTTIQAGGTIHVYYVADTYTVKYDANAADAIGTMEDQTFTCGAGGQLNANAFSRPNYTFQGWATEPDGEVVYTDQASVKDLAAAGGEITLYAVWDEQTATINYEVVGAAGCGSVSRESEIVGLAAGTVQGSTATANEGYYFVGWYSDKDCETQVSTNADYKPARPTTAGTVTYYAKFAEKKTLTIQITGNSATKTYSGGEQSVSDYTVVNEAALPGDVSVDLKDGVTATASGTDVGTYQMGLTADSFEVTAPAGYDVTLNVTDGTLTITKATLTVKADDKTKTYDGNPYTEFTSTITGFKGTDTASVVTGDVTYTGTAVDAVKKGEYVITPVVTGLSATNYDFVSANGTLTITAKTLTAEDLTFTADDKVYDGDTEATGTVGFKTSIEGLTVSADFMTFADKNVADGKTVTASGLTLGGAAAGNYTLTPGLTLTVTANITKRNVTLTSADASKTYDGTALTNDQVDVSGDGFVDGEGAAYSVTGTQITVGSSHNTFTYALNSNTLEQNYNITTVEGTLKVLGKVAYDANAGDDTVSGMPTDDNTYELGVNVTADTTATPIRQNYTFAGWMLSADGTETVTEGTMGETGLTFYAKWTRDTYQVTVQYEISDNGTTFTDTTYTDSQPNPFTVDAGNSWTIAVGTGSGNYTAPATLTVGDKTYVYDAKATGNDLTGDAAETVILKYGLDEKGNGNDGEDPDGTPDYYQVFVKYEATEGGSLSGTTYEAYDLRDAEGMATSVTLTFPTPVAETKYVFDGWTNPTGVTVDGTTTTMSDFTAGETYTFTANFEKDVLVDPSEEDKTPGKPGDGIPDKYQVTVYYEAVNGTVSFGSTVVTKKDANGDPAADGTAKLAKGHIPTATPIAGYVAAGNLWTPVTPDVDLPVMDGQTFTANYVYIPPYIPPTDPGTDIDDEDVPLADLPGLNTVDHYAYIAGYEDGTVRPNNNITRAEVATIFFRLFTDEYRETYWSTNNPFSDVAYTAWYNNAVSTTSNAGIIAGYPDGTFQPNNYITRAEFATIAARFLSEEYVGPDLFTDISGHWAAEYINRAANAGWINGYPDGSFRPNAYITRAEAMTLVNSMLGRMPHKDHMLENMVKWPDNPEAAWYYEAVQEATNGHDYDWYEEEDQLFYEIWTALQPNRDWAALEKEWSNAYSAPGGEVDG